MGRAGCTKAAFLRWSKMMLPGDVLNGASFVLTEHALSSHAAVFASLLLLVRGGSNEF